MKRALPFAAIVITLLLSCKSQSKRMAPLPIDSEFVEHVEAVIGDFEEVHKNFKELLHEYDNHLYNFKHGEPEQMDTYAAYYDGAQLGNIYIDTSLSAHERLDIVDAKIDNLVDCAWDFEQAYSLHHNEFHGEWHVEWAKFYSPVSDSLPRNARNIRITRATYIRLVEENLKGVAGFIASLRLDFEEHLNMYH